jgi:ATP-dependent Clp protease ATP-binding subunit ClpC
MANSSNGYTGEARELLVAAHTESTRLRHPFIGTEHLVLAMTGREDGTAAALLRAMSVDMQEVRQTIENAVRRGDESARLEGDRPFTSRTKKVLELAGESARELRSDEVGTEHLLLGLLREGKGIGGAVLIQHGLTEEGVKEEIRKLPGEDAEIV